MPQDGTHHPLIWSTIQFPDVNGDGKADVCGRATDGIYCSLSNGAADFGPATIWAPNFSNANGWDSSESYWGSIQFSDINGDGMADVCGRRIAGIECALSTGTAFGSASVWATAYSDAAGFNGDATRWATLQFPDLKAVASLAP